jgi:hypothetical protein
MQTSPMTFLGGTLTPLQNISLKPEQQVGVAEISIPARPNLKKWQRAAKLNGASAHEPTPDGSGHRTRLDMDFARLLKKVGDYIEVKVILPPQFFFFRNDGLSVTAQNQEGSDSFFNLKFLDTRTVCFDCIYPASPLQYYPRFNLLFTITDEDSSAFSLPVIIDPAIRNRG